MSDSSHVLFLATSWSRFTVPVLWDNKLNTIVNNESSEIIRIFNSAFNHLLPADKAAVDIYPEAHRQEIDSINEWVYETINSASEFLLSIFGLGLTNLRTADGVYKAGFTTSQSVYENAVYSMFKSLDRLEEMLKGGKDYLVGNILTEADIRLFVTVVRMILYLPFLPHRLPYFPQIRFDPVYFGHFKCNIRDIRHGYPNIHL
jgi:putative glutathione S-transferase